MSARARGPVRRALAAAAGLAAALLAGCASIQLGAPTASLETVQRARAAGLPAMAVGEFALAPGKPTALDASFSLRTNTVFSPYGRSFAHYLKETLAAELKAAGLLDPAAAAEIRGWLTESQVDGSMGTGLGRVCARFAVLRGGQQLYDKEFSAENQWESPYLGVVAIPLAINHYTVLHRQLVGQLLADPDFVAALRR